MATQTISFSIEGSFITNTARDIWVSDLPKNAFNLLIESLGMNQEQARSVILGDYKLTGVNTLSLEIDSVNLSEEFNGDFTVSGVTSRLEKNITDTVDSLKRYSENDERDYSHKVDALTKKLEELNEQLEFIYTLPENANKSMSKFNAQLLSPKKSWKNKQNWNFSDEIELNAIEVFCERNSLTAPRYSGQIDHYISNYGEEIRKVYDELVTKNKNAKIINDILKEVDSYNSRVEQFHDEIKELKVIDDCLQNRHELLHDQYEQFLKYEIEYSISKLRHKLIAPIPLFSDYNVESPQNAYITRDGRLYVCPTRGHSLLEESMRACPEFCKQNDFVESTYYINWLDSNWIKISSGEIAVNYNANITEEMQETLLAVIENSFANGQPYTFWKTKKIYSKSIDLFADVLDYSINV